jgi:hypothetical protein
LPKDLHQQKTRIDPIKLDDTTVSLNQRFDGIM